MTREELEKLWPILEAYRQGKTIEVYNPSTEEWDEKDDPYFDEDPDYYRIVEGPKYRPFKNSEECWEEMKKHRPFGWIKSKQFGSYSSIGTVCKGSSNALIIRSTDECRKDSMNFIYENYIFADGTPFGKKEE